MTLDSRIFVLVKLEVTRQPLSSTYDGVRASQFKRLDKSCFGSKSQRPEDFQIVVKIMIFVYAESALLMMKMTLHYSLCYTVCVAHP